MARDVGFEYAAPQFMIYLKQNIREVTAISYVKRLELLNKVGNLNDTEKIKNIICSYGCAESFKELLAECIPLLCTVQRSNLEQTQIY